MSDRLAPLPRRLLGLGMIALVVALLGLCVALYNKVFTDRVRVTVHIAQVDNSFLPNAEVRMHGVTVGEVTTAEAQGDGAVLHLALDEDRAAQIPRNVRAMILPKSLFGESFLALQTTEAPVAERIQAGDDIPRDRSGRAVQTEQLLSHLLPLIEAVRPADLANTLGALNQALDGRGERLGDTVTRLHRYLSRFNPALPDLTADIRALPPVTETYSQAAPDLIEGLRQLNTTSDTLVEHEADLRTLFATGTEASHDLRDFLDRSGDDLIRLVHVASPTLDLLARYSPEYVCVLKRVSDAIPVASKVFKEGSDRPALAVRVVITATRGKYLPRRDEPEFTDNRGPACYDNTPPLPQYPGGPYQDGSTHPPAVSPGSLLSDGFPPIPSSVPAVPAVPLLGGTGAGEVIGR
jgi:virulence factor Mce-like protein